MFFLRSSILTVATILLFSVTGTASAATTSSSQITQYMSGVQVLDGAVLTNKPVKIRATAGKLTYDQGWATYNNSVTTAILKILNFFYKRTFRQLAPTNATASTHEISRHLA
jgi:hypothetical protein